MSFKAYSVEEQRWQNDAAGSATQSPEVEYSMNEVEKEKRTIRIAV